MNEKLSSSWTLFYKLIFPIVWISGFGIGTIVLWLASFDPIKSPPSEMKWMFLFAWLTGSSFIIWFSLRLKHVTLTDKLLIVKGYFKEIEVPISSVNYVSESMFVNPKTIKLSIYPESEFGSTIVFMPKVKLYNPFKQHPITKQLMQLSNQPY